MSQPEFHIRTNGLYWRPEAKGYTSDVRDAGRWSEADALRLIEDLGTEKHAGIVRAAPCPIRALIDAALPFANAFEAFNELDPGFPDEGAVMRASVSHAAATRGLSLDLTEDEYTAKCREQVITKAKLQRLAEAVRAAEAAR